jgi:hypothetical protein
MGHGLNATLADYRRKNPWDQTLRDVLKAGIVAFKINRDNCDSATAAHVRQIPFNVAVEWMTAKGLLIRFLRVDKAVERGPVDPEQPGGLELIAARPAQGILQGLRVQFATPVAPVRDPG